MKFELNLRKRDIPEDGLLADLKKVAHLMKPATPVFVTGRRANADTLCPVEGPISLHAPLMSCFHERVRFYL